MDRVFECLWAVFFSSIELDMRFEFFGSAFVLEESCCFILAEGYMRLSAPFFDSLVCFRAGISTRMILMQN